MWGERRDSCCLVQFPPSRQAPAGPHHGSYLRADSHPPPSLRPRHEDLQLHEEAQRETIQDCPGQTFLNQEEKIVFGEQNLVQSRGLELTIFIWQQLPINFPVSHGSLSTTRYSIEDPTNVVFDFTAFIIIEMTKVILILVVRSVLIVD